MIIIRHLAAGSFVLALAYASRIQAQPVRPSPDQAAALFQAGLDSVTQLRQPLLGSALSSEQVRARLKVEGYPENLLDRNLSRTGVRTGLEAHRVSIDVNGHAWNPGQQGFSPGLTLEQAFRRAGGVKPDAYPGRVLVTRLNADSTRTQLRVMLRDTSVVVPAKGKRTEASSVLQTLPLVAQTMATPVAAIAITQ